MEDSQKKTVLVVDDEEQIREMANIFLTNNGYKVITGNNGNDLIKYAADSVDIILLDHQMPEKSGLEALAELHQAGKSPKGKVIMTSSALNDEQKKKATAYGVVDFLPKPFVLNVVLEKIKKYVGSSNPADASKSELSLKPFPPAKEYFRS